MKKHAALEEFSKQMKILAKENPSLSSFLFSDKGLSAIGGGAVAGGILGQLWGDKSKPVHLNMAGGALPFVGAASGGAVGSWGGLQLAKKLSNPKYQLMALLGGGLTGSLGGVLGGFAASKKLTGSLPFPNHRN